MDGQAREFMWIKDAGKLEVPFFQRPYVWDEEDFTALIESFLDAPGKTMPFFGSVIFKKIGDEENSYHLIVDGQQRITTFNILIRALLDLRGINAFQIAPTIEQDLKYVLYNIEVDDEGVENYELRLVPSNSDKKSFEQIMDVSSKRPLDIDTLGDTPIEKAYTFFYTYFSSDKERAKEFCIRLYNKNKSMIYIILDNKDDEQKIFDSVNSLGKVLSNSDIIKNYLFQKLKEKAGNDSVQQKEVMDLYYKYWDAIFYSADKKTFGYTKFTVGRITTDHLESLLKDVAIVKKIYAAKKTTGTYGLCNAYKNYINDLDNVQLKELVKDIYSYAEVYYKYKTEYADLKRFAWDDAKNRLLLIFDVLETSTFNPYLLKLFKENASDMEEKMLRLEKFFLTRFIYEAKTKNYNQCCEGLINAIDDEIYFNEYMKESPPDSTSYKNKFRKLTNKQGVLFLFLIEMLIRRGQEDKYSDVLNIGLYTLEHIMPQKWNTNNDWFKVPSYDENGKQIDTGNMQAFLDNRNSAVGSIGNFALLTAKLNSSVSNSSFEIKINGNGKKNGQGIKAYAAALATTKAVIDIYDSSANWDEKNIYKKEKEYFGLLNDFYGFE
ncbi:MAG: DUF262 domain-containing HNH endonuclease family protein [Lachnospiraceae bacterium]|nr:DUF262 domain-containing HNH endonuclease family protein [Lachnospiraceae bacterium]